MRDPRITVRLRHLASAILKQNSTKTNIRRKIFRADGYSVRASAPTVEHVEINHDRLVTVLGKEVAEKTTEHVHFSL